MPYTTPTLTDFRMRFPEFGAVPDDRVSYWLADAIPRVGDSWTEQDRAPATLLLVAHNLAASGALASEGDLPTGVTSLRSGSLSITMDAAYVASASEGGYAATKYGREFARLTRLNFGGSRVSGSGVVVGGCGSYLSGLHPSW